MQKHQLLRWLLPITIVAGSLFTANAVASASETSALPAATDVAVATAVTSSEDFSSLDGTWMDTADGRKYRYADGSFAINIQIVDGISYIFQSDGVQLTGWQNFEGAWHYYDPKTYTAAVGQQEIDSTVYLFDYTGAQKTGWRTVDGIRRYYDPETGKEVVGWIDYGKNRYFVDSASGKLTGECIIGGIPYMLDSETGLQLTGFQTFSDSTVRYYAQNGSPVYGWLKQPDSGAVYYFGSDYAMQIGKIEIEGALYYFAKSGIMQTGWQTIRNDKYYFTKNGAAAKGLTSVGSKIYYFSKNGVMQTGWQKVDGKTYYFSADGSAVTGEKVIDGKSYRFDASTGVLKQYKICLDAGHYGKYNISPVNSAYYESDMSWKLHLYLKDALESYGFEVVTTRPAQAQDLALETRGKTAEGCDLFLSLHSNAAPNTTADGPLACCTVTGTADDLGLALANLVHEVMGTRQGGSIWKRIGMNGDYYGVLRGATSVGVPAILLEHSYHTNPRATAWLLVDSNLEKLAKAEAKLLASYFGLI